MRVAICISGQARDVEECYPTVHRWLIKSYKSDVFIWFWKSKYHKGERVKFNDRGLEDIELANTLYKPVISKSQSQIDFSRFLTKWKGNTALTPFYGASMFYAIQQANALKKSHEQENSFRYDIVFRLRSDLFMTSMKIPKIIEPDTVYSPIIKSHGTICDMVGFGDSRTMDKYSTVYDRLDDLLECNGTLSNEKLLKLKLDGDKVRVEPCDVGFLVYRQIQSEPPILMM